MTTPGRPAPTTTDDADRARLHELGYAQELRRRFSWFSNFAISFSIISILAGAITTYYLGGLLKAQGYYEVSQLVWIFFLIFTVALTFASRETARSYLRARFADSGQRKESNSDKALTREEKARYNIARYCRCIVHSVSTNIGLPPGGVRRRRSPAKEGDPPRVQRRKAS